MNEKKEKYKVKEETKELISFLRQTAKNLETGKIKADSTIRLRDPDPRATVVLRIIRRHVEPRREEAIGVEIVACDECEGKGCSRCGQFGWLILDEVSEGRIDYTPILGMSNW